MNRHVSTAASTVAQNGQTKQNPPSGPVSNLYCTLYVKAQIKHLLTKSKDRDWKCDRLA